MRCIAKVGGGLGDLATIMPVLHALIRNNYSVELIVNQSHASLLDDCGFLADVHGKSSKKMNISGDLSLYKRIFSCTWDLAVNLSKGMAFTLFARLAGTKRIRTWADMDMDMQADSYVRFRLSLLADIIADWYDPVETAIPFSTAVHTRARARAKLDADTDYLTVAPGSSAPEKCWPADNFALVLEQLRNYYSHIILLGTPAERQLCERLASFCAGTNLAGKASLIETAALVSNATQHLGNDSGLGHVAAANGTPVLAIGGEPLYRPWQQKMLTGPVAHITPAQVLDMLRNDSNGDAARPRAEPA